MLRGIGPVVGLLLMTRGLDMNSGFFRATD
jgi:hypothetical protein